MVLLKKRSANTDLENSKSPQISDQSLIKTAVITNKKSSNNIEYKIQLLNDGEQPLAFSIKKTDKGQKLFDLLWEYLGNINERDYFGLRYTDKYRQRRWLDLSKSAYKQLKDSKSFGMCFRVKYYPKNPLDDFQSEIAKRLLFLQIRRDLAQGRLLCGSSEAGILGALVVQALRGDAPVESQSGDNENVPNDALRESWDLVYKSRIVFNQTQEIEDNIRAEHRKIRGETAEQAMDQLLDLACRMPTYGVDPSQVKPLHKIHLPKSPENELVPLPKDCLFYLGITGDGIVTFVRLERAEEYLWENIHHLACDGKQFLVYLKKNSDRENPLRRHRSNRIPDKSNTLPVQSHDTTSYNLHPKLDVLTFVCASKAAALALWYSAVDQKCFFTLNTAQEAKKVRSAKTLFSRNHTFRFSGRSQHEINQGRMNMGTADREILRNLRDDQTRSTFPGRIRAKIDTTQDRHSGLENILEASPIASPDGPRSCPSVDHVTNLLDHATPVTSSGNMSPKCDGDVEHKQDENAVIDTAGEIPIEQVKIAQQFHASNPPDGSSQRSRTTSSRTEPESEGADMDIHKRQEQVVTDLEQTIKNHSSLTETTTIDALNGEVSNLDLNRNVYQNGPTYMTSERKLENHVNGNTKHESVTTSTKTSKSVDLSDEHRSRSSKMPLVMIVLMLLVGVIAILEATPKPNPENNRNALFRLIRANPVMANLDTYVYNPVRSTIVHYWDSLWAHLKE